MSHKPDLETVVVRELKTHLSRHLRRVRTGVRLTITERGRSIATIQPVERTEKLDWAHKLVADGLARWNGGKPAGSRNPPQVKGRTAASLVREDRR